MCADALHNRHCSNRQGSSGVSVLVADRCPDPTHHPEAETVKVTVSHTAVELELHDGETLTFCAGDLRAAIGEAA